MKIVLLALITLLSIDSMARANRYIGGDKWNKPRINKSIFENQNTIVTDLILRTGKIVNKKTGKVGTTFLFQETPENYIFLTNYHVMAGSRECRNARILLLDASFKRHVLKCQKIIKEGKIIKKKYRVILRFH